MSFMRLKHQRGLTLYEVGTVLTIISIMSVVSWSLLQTVNFAEADYDETSGIIDLQMNLSLMMNWIADGIASTSRRGGYEAYRKGINTAQDYKIESYQGKKNAKLTLYGSEITRDRRIKAGSEWQVEIKWGKISNRDRDSRNDKAQRAIYITYPGWKDDLGRELAQDEKRHQARRLIPQALPSNISVINCEFIPGNQLEKLPNGFDFKRKHGESPRNYLLMRYAIQVTDRNGDVLDIQEFEQLVHLQNTTHQVIAEHGNSF
ncbi:MAG: type II secretion system protein [Gemmatimonadetes bacterium]|nr:MAG: type II secretion system protein [Gemmatimonadota bacterium]